MLTTARFMWLLCLPFVVPYYLLGYPFVAAAAAIYGAIYASIYFVARRWSGWPSRWAAHSFVFTAFTVIIYLSALGRLDPMFSCFSVFVPFLSYLIGSKTIMWTWSSFIFCLSSASMGHLWRPSTTFPRLVPAFSDTGHHYFIILNTVIFFGIFAFVIHAFLNLVAQMLQQRRHMLATVSHEIRTPLHSICFNAKQLANQAGIQGTEEVHRLLSDVTHLVDLTNDVLDLTKMEGAAGEDAEPTLLPLSMIELGEALNTLIEGTAERQRLSGYEVPHVGLQVSYESVPAVVMLDRPRVLQTVLNFVSNAIKYAGALGEIEVSVKHAQNPPKTKWSEGYTEGKAAAAYLVFEVHDKGRLKGDPAQLFLPFETGISERQLGGRSSLGLGLAICSLNARRMHGTVGHYCRGQEKETVFFLAVPLHEAAVGSVERNRQVLQSLREPGLYKILAVDDERVNLLICKWFVDSNFPVL